MKQSNIYKLQTHEHQRTQYGIIELWNTGIEIKASQSSYSLNVSCNWYVMLRVVGAFLDMRPVAVHLWHIKMITKNCYVFMIRTSLGFLSLLLFFISTGLYYIIHSVNTLFSFDTAEKLSTWLLPKIPGNNSLFLWFDKHQNVGWRSERG